MLTHGGSVRLWLDSGSGVGEDFVDLEEVTLGVEGGVDEPVESGEGAKEGVVGAVVVEGLLVGFDEGQEVLAVGEEAFGDFGLGPGAGGEDGGGGGDSSLASGEDLI